MCKFSISTNLTQAESRIWINSSKIGLFDPVQNLIPHISFPYSLYIEIQNINIEENWGNTVRDNVVRIYLHVLQNCWGARLDLSIWSSIFVTFYLCYLFLSFAKQLKDVLKFFLFFFFLFETGPRPFLQVSHLFRMARDTEVSSDATMLANIVIFQSSTDDHEGHREFLSC